MTETNLWTAANVQIGKLLLAVAHIQSFVHCNWTSAQARHKSLPTSGVHYCRAQMRHSSMLAVHACPIPNDSSDNKEDHDVDIFMRRKKLSAAWELMQSCDTELWTDVCHLYSMVLAVEKDPEQFAENQAILDEVAEARHVMNNAEILAAVETIESFRQEEWSSVQASTAIRHGSELTVHEHHHDESTVEAMVRHREHADAWTKMKTCDKGDWTSACHHHEEYVKKMLAKREMLDAAVWVIQDFNSKNWTSAHLQPEEDPHWKASQIRHGSSLAVHENPLPDFDDPVYHAHRERLIEAWKIMKQVGSEEWTKACKFHEDEMTAAEKSPLTPFKLSNPGSFQQGLRAPMKNSVNGKAA